MIGEALPSAADPQLDLFSRDAGLDAELWTRRHHRLDQARGATLSREDAPLAPLVLSLARLAAQRDARLILQAAEPARAA